MDIFIAAIAGFLVGAALVWLAGSRRERSARELADRLGQENAALRVRLEERERAAAEKLAAIGDAEAKLREAFQALSADALRSNNEAFLQPARATLEKFQQGAQNDLAGRQKAIGDLVSPVQEALKLVDAKLQAMEKEREGAYRALKQQVELMASTQERLKSETANLVQALRAPTVRGRWGEIHLRRVVELAGMVEHCDFEEQASVETEGGRLRPDLIVHLPGGKQVIVDAKVPLKAYLEAQEAGDETAREAKLDEHARQVREHIVRLGAKSYWDQFESAPDFVVMFIPGEALFAAAIQRDAGLLEYGFERNVYPASPATLISLLKAAYYGWQQEKVAESAQKIRDLGAELYDRLVKMAEHFSELGTHLDRAITAYDETVGSFERRVLVSARRFKEFGAGTSKDLPEVEPIERSPRGLPRADE